MTDLAKHIFDTACAINQSLAHQYVSGLGERNKEAEAVEAKLIEQIKKLNVHEQKEMMELIEDKYK